MKNLLKKVLDGVWPIYCLLCDSLCANKKSICDTCYLSLPIHQIGCTRCGLAAGCGNCHSSPPPFDNTFALFNYETPISELIAKLKFQNNLATAKLFSQYWIDYFLDKKHLLPELIIPVPLHHMRLKKRGFNQTLEIAKPIGKYFQIPIDIRSCIKLKNTEPQSSLSSEKRKKNLKNAFAISHSIIAKHVAVIDDVMTTGNTVSEISCLLKKAGVERVDIWCCARVLK
ncbi:MAG: phosphoribosyltransferase family protein [Gammaproteobacteria bacterium]|nr:phosphoribosyltransferase family protein [Gammaproteobacteria bacterium]